jgi:peroxiredoxin
LCNSELRSFQQQKSAFARRNVQVVAISVDASEESARLAGSQGYDFPILSDPGARVIREYGVVHEHGGEEGKDIARPAEFLVDHAGTIRWVNLSPNILARLRPQTALDAIDQIITQQRISMGAAYDLSSATGGRPSTAPSRSRTTAFPA